MGTVVWPLGDQVGTIRDLVTYDAETQTTALANHRNYDSFGNLVSETPNAAVDELFGFTGRMFDDATGLQNNFNRWYDPGVGKWISEDPIGFGGGDTNLARYVGNDATNKTDPIGLAGIGTKNHVYPLYLGGAPGGVGYDFPCEADHETFHNSLDRRFNRYDSALARERWLKLSEAERRSVLADALRAGGATDQWIKDNMDDVMKGAKPGVNRSGVDRKPPVVRPDPHRSPAANPKRIGLSEDTSISSGRRARKGILVLPGGRTRGPSPANMPPLAASCLKGTAADLGRTQGPALAAAALHGALSENTSLLDGPNAEMALIYDTIDKARNRLAGIGRQGKYGWLEWFDDFMLVHGAAMNGL